jgi:NADH dehydrogenase
LDDVWALGDNAHIPLGEPGDPKVAYAPPLAQFAVREGKALAQNVLAHLKGDTPKPFEYRSMGTMASLGARTGVADILGVRITGFFAWTAWRLFYLSLLPSMATRIRVAMDWGLDLIISRSIAEIRTTQAGSRYIRFLAGDLVIEPGVDPGGLYVVISGAFDSETPAADQPRTLGPNSCFGMAIGGEAGSDQERITAREDSTVYFVEKSDLKRLALVSALIKQGDGIKASPRSGAESNPGRDGPS